MVRRALLLVVVAAVGVSLTWASAAGAQLASRPAADWIRLLDAPERIARLQVDEILARVKPAPGEVVADLGAGTGVFSIPLARAVAPGGTVYAVEVDPELVQYIREKGARERVGNLEPLLGQFGDPGLPRRDVDLAFFHDVLHHVSDRPGYLRQLITYLKPTARIAIVEMDPVKGPHRNDPALQITKAELNGWMATLGYRRRELVDLSETTWLAVYTRQ